MRHIALFESFVGERLYHGNRKGDFPPKMKRFGGCIFLTSNLAFAKDFSGADERSKFPDGAVWEVWLKPGVNLCDPMDPKIAKKLDLKGVIEKMIVSGYEDETNGTKFKPVSASGMKGYDYDTDREFDVDDPGDSVYHYLWRIKHGAWRIIECAPILEAIKKSGYDGFCLVERGSKNVAIFDENSIREFKKIED
jgi:hypothetical protein